MIAVERLTDNAAKINHFVNHPAIYPFVKGSNAGPLDLSSVVRNPAHVVLVSDHGGMIFIKHQTGVYEFHSAVLPENRGEWTARGAVAAFHWMFTKTDAFELMTKCPHGNVAASAGAKFIGMTKDFTTRPIWLTDEGMVPVDVYGLRIQDWVRRAPGLVEIGHEFHERLAAQLKAKGRSEEIHADDETHDRYVGATAAMFEHGLLVKAVAFYNRWAVMSGYVPIKLLSRDPAVINIGTAVLKVTGGQFEVCDANVWN